MAKNNFKPFATGAGANVTSQSDYEALAALLSGFSAGKASSAQINKALRQSTFIAAGIAQFIMNKLTMDVLDDGDLTGFVTDFVNALNYSPQFTGVPAAPTPESTLNNNQIATTAFVQTLITALVGGAPANLNTLNKIALSLGNDPIFAANVNAALVLKSPLNSPQFTGVPAAPTPDVGLNNNQIATTAFVKAALAALIDSAPGALDTLKELAAALGNDPNFATTITNALALKAPLASPTFTGDPRAPTPVAGDNDTSIATTAFITAALTAFLPKRVFTANDFIRIPDVPGGLIIQWGGMSVADSNGLCVANYPTPFPAGPLASTATYYNASRNNITTTLASTTASQIQAFASYAHTNVPAVGAPLRYLTLGF